MYTDVSEMLPVSNIRAMGSLLMVAASSSETSVTCRRLHVGTYEKSSDFNIHSHAKLKAHLNGHVLAL